MNFHRCLRSCDESDDGGDDGGDDVLMDPLTERSRQISRVCGLLRSGALWQSGFVEKIPISDSEGSESCQRCGKSARKHLECSPQAHGITKEG